MQKRKIAYIVILSLIVIGCVWAFIAAGVITKNFKKEVLTNAGEQQQLNIKNLIITETKNDEKYWELYAESGYYDNKNKVAILYDLVGNFYDKGEVVLSMISTKGTFEEETKKVEEPQKIKESINDTENRNNNLKQNNEHNEKNKFQNNKPKFENNRQRNFENNNRRQNNFNRNNGENRDNRRNFEKGNKFQNRNNGNFKNNQRKSLDEKGIEKNIKNIMAQDLGEKETTREYNRSMTKQKNNKNNLDENRQRKNAKSRRDESFDTGKLKNLKQESKLSNMFGDIEGGMLDYYDLTTVRGKRGKKKNNPNEERNKQKIFKLTEITIPESITADAKYIVRNGEELTL